MAAGVLTWRRWMPTGPLLAVPGRFPLVFGGGLPPPPPRRRLCCHASSDLQPFPWTYKRRGSARESERHIVSKDGGLAAGSYLS